MLYTSRPQPRPSAKPVVVLVFIKLWPKGSLNQAFRVSYPLVVRYILTLHIYLNILYIIFIFSFETHF